MRIIHLTKYLPEFPGGIEQATRTMALVGTELGAEVEIIGVQPASEDCCLSPPPSISELPLRFLNFHIGNVPFAPGFFLLREKLSRADLVHVHLPNPMAELALLWFLSQDRTGRMPPLVPVVHAPLMRWSVLAGVWRRVVQNQLMANSESLIVPTEELLTCLKLSTPFAQEKKTHVIPFGIPAAPRVSFSRQSSRPVRLLTIGRLVPYKGFELLFDSLTALSGEWRLTLVGKGPLGYRLRERRDELGLRERVEIFEGVSEERKHQLFDECDIFVLPSQTIAESFGLVIAEAFSHGKAVVTTALPTGVAFLARGGECGAVVEVGSRRDLAHGIERLVRDPDRRVECGRANFEFWKRELNMDRYRERYQTFLSQFAERRRKIAA